MYLLTIIDYDILVKNDLFELIDLCVWKRKVYGAIYSYLVEMGKGYHLIYQSSPVSIDMQGIEITSTTAKERSFSHVCHIFIL